MKPEMTIEELGGGRASLGVKQKPAKARKLEWQRRDLNPRPGAYESPALPPELRCRKTI